MSYCLNPECSNPKNPNNVKTCRSCGSSLLLRDRYYSYKMLGKGGFGATFLASDISLPGKPFCVIKQLRPTSSNPGVYKMAKKLFSREAETLGRIGNHPQVPSLRDYFEDRNQVYLVQEFAKGQDLQKEIKANGPFNEEKTKQFLQEFLPVIDYIHSQDVIHRDIKPANLIRREQDHQLVLIDFGAVKDPETLRNAGGNSAETHLTEISVGTQGYAPPEQLAMRPVFASDIFAIGVTCIYLLTGKQPKEFDYNPRTGEMDWQKFVNMTNHFSEVLMKMMEMSVRHRYKSAKEVLDALNMEPYMNSLQDSLIAKPPTTINQQQNDPFKSFQGVTTGLNPGSSTSIRGDRLSATQRLAQALRDRKQRTQTTNILGAPQNTGIAGNQTPFNSTTHIGSTSDPNPSTSIKTTQRRIRMNASEILSAYAGGRRDFADFDFNGLDLKQVDLSEAKFDKTRFIQANLEKTNLSGSVFRGANLSKAMLRNANLNKVVLDGANLQGADLRGANLSRAILRNTNFKGANLCGANLTGAKVTQQQLESAKLNWQTILPNGKRGIF